MDYNTALDIVAKEWNVDKVLIENTLSNIKRKMELSPCTYCEQGWGKITTDGYESCADECVTLKYWKEQHK